MEGQIEEVVNKINPPKMYSVFVPSISKNDLMFYYWLYHTESFRDALLGYFQSGVQQAESIRNLLIDQKFNLDKLKLLDFASGHGRVSRYFKCYVNPDNIFISDIKLNAVEFQRSNFNYQGFLAPENPNECRIEFSFDFISVSSLFTHLNEDLFGRWLAVLGGYLNLGGILSFSIHKLVSENDIFKYSEVSEDDLFRETDDSLSGRKIYGVTSLSLVKLTKILTQCLNFDFVIVDERKWGDSQVLISIKRLS
jgi:SAM-dependent methyltransferase